MYIQYIYMLVEIVGNLHSKLRCGTKESFQSWRQTKTTSEALQREQCHRGAHGLGRWRVLQDLTTIWFNLIQLYWSIFSWDTWWLVVEWVLNKPKGSIRAQWSASFITVSLVFSLFSIFLDDCKLDTENTGDGARRLRWRIWWRHACVTWLSSKDRIQNLEICRLICPSILHPVET